MWGVVQKFGYENEMREISKKVMAQGRNSKWKMGHHHHIIMSLFVYMRLLVLGPSLSLSLSHSRFRLFLYDSFSLFFFLGPFHFSN